MCDRVVCGKYHGEYQNMSCAVKCPQRNVNDISHCMDFHYTLKIWRGIQPYPGLIRTLIVSNGKLKRYILSDVGIFESYRNVDIYVEAVKQQGCRKRDRSQLIK